MPTDAVPPIPRFPGRRQVFRGDDPWCLTRAVAAALGEGERGGHVLLVDPPLDTLWWRDLLPIVRDAPLHAVATSTIRLPLPDHPAHALPWILHDDPPAPDPERLPGTTAPVHLVSIPRHGEPPWPVTATSPAEAIRDATRWLVEREPRWWPCPWPVTPATLAVAGDHTANGRRVLVSAPGDLTLLAPTLARIGLLQQPVTVIVDRLPETELPGWWIVGAEDAHETATLLAQAVQHEWPTLIVATVTSTAMATARAPASFMPGSGRWLRPRRPGAPAVVCTAHGAAACLTAAAAHPDVGVFRCTSLQPLPETDLRRLAFDGPVLVAEDRAFWSHRIAACVGGQTMGCAARAELVAKWIAQPGQAMA